MDFTKVLLIGAVVFAVLLVLTLAAAGFAGANEHGNDDHEYTDGADDHH